jgi:hypothetical protein
LIPWTLNRAWQSDFAGHEVGYPEIEIVGCYSLTAADGIYNFMIDTENSRVVSITKEEDDER